MTIIHHRPLSQILAETNSRKSKKRDNAEQLVADAWAPFEKTKNDFRLPNCTIGMEYVIFNVRAPCTPVALFMKFATPALLESIWNHAIQQDANVWVYSLKPTIKTINGNKFNLSLIYKYLAIYVIIQALQQKPKRNTRQRTALTDNLKHAKDFFEERFQTKTPSVNILKRLVSK